MRCPGRTAAWRLLGACLRRSARGTYRVGGDVLLSDENGVSEISGADFAHAIIDEVESPSHRRARMSVAY